MILVIQLAVLFTAALVSGVPLDEAEISRLAMENPDLFEGDILGIDPDDRNVIPNKNKRWPKGRIPYVIEPTLKPITGLIQEAMEEYHQKTCIRFVPKQGREQEYMFIFEGRGCYSQVGMERWSEHPVSLGRGCHHKGIIIHELGHAIGFYHEQNRSDRDDYLIIHWENIKEGMANQFNLLKPQQNLLLTPFDYDSIMLYGNTAFTKQRGLFTMEAKTGQPLLGAVEKGGLAPSDIERIRQMYDC